MEKDNANLIKEIRDVISEEIQKNNETLSKRILQRSLWAIISVLVVSASFNIFLLTRSNPSQNDVNNNTSEIVKLVPPSTSEKLQNSFDITNFSTNPAISEVGATLKITSNSIRTQNNTNCQTPILPPEVNGCGFVILPSLTGIPTTKKIYSKLNIQGQIPDSSEIYVNLKNYETGSVAKNLGVINSSKTSILLPENIDSVEGILIEFWQKGGDINIEKINIEYYYAENLKNVQFKIENLADNQSLEGIIYLDQNEDGKLDTKIDKQWICRPNFPGVRKVTFKKGTDSALLRDDSCYTQSKPEDWQSDNQKRALPQGKWLLFIDQTNKVYSFEITDKQENIVTITL